MVEGVGVIAKEGLYHSGLLCRHIGDLRFVIQISMFHC